MYYEEVRMPVGVNLQELSLKYGFYRYDYTKIWDDPKNASIRAIRGSAGDLKQGDRVYLPINLKITTKYMTHFQTAWRYQIRATRSGTKGEYIYWLQTVYGSNQPNFGSPFSVDWPKDDNLPFYYTMAELKQDDHRRTEFFDSPNRPPPNRANTSTHDAATTGWRAVLSIGVVTGKRVTICDAIVWGVDFPSSGYNLPYVPRAATHLEIAGHINLLNLGRGKTRTFRQDGWKFRKQPL